MAEFTVIGITGLQGSGKTEVAKILAKFDIPCVRMGDMVWAEVKRRGLELNEANVAAVADELRRREGLGAVAARCIPAIEESAKGKRAVAVHGVRGIAEVEEFRKAFGDRFFLVAIWASEGTRYLRVTGRGREDDVAGLEAFRERDRRELGWGLGEALALSDAMIINEGSLAELKLKVEEIFRSLVGDEFEVKRQG